MASNNSWLTDSSRVRPQAGTPPSEAGPSGQRVFVVHFFTTAARPGRRRFSGRVEHLPSGRVASFSSLRELLSFTAAVDAGPLEGPRPEAQEASRGVAHMSSTVDERSAGPCPDDDRVGRFSPAATPSARINEACSVRSR